MLNVFFHLQRIADGGLCLPYLPVADEEKSSSIERSGERILFDLAARKICCKKKPGTGRGEPVGTIGFVCKMKGASFITSRCDQVDELDPVKFAVWFLRPNKKCGMFEHHHDRTRR